MRVETPFGDPTFTYPDQVRHLIAGYEYLGQGYGHGWRLILHNGRKVDFWPTTGTCGPMGGPHFKRQGHRLPAVVKEVAAMPGVQEYRENALIGLSDEVLIAETKQAYPLDPRIHPKGLMERSMVHELARRLLERPLPELLLTDEVER